MEKIDQFNTALIAAFNTWKKYGTNIGSAKQWGKEHMGSLQEKFINLFSQFCLEHPQFRLEFVDMNKWFVNAITQWCLTGQGGNGNLFANWLRSFITAKWIPFLQKIDRSKIVIPDPVTGLLSTEVPIAEQPRRRSGNFFKKIARELKRHNWSINVNVNA